MVKRVHGVHYATVLGISGEHGRIIICERADGVSVELSHARNMLLHPSQALHLARCLRRAATAATKANPKGE